MARVYVGSIDPRTSEREVEDEFRLFGRLRSVWIARKPPGYAFVDFEDKRDAVDAVKSLNGRNGWRVELSHNSAGGSSRGSHVPRRRGGEDNKCYECNEPGHFARECRLRVGPSGLGSRRHARSRSPRYRSSHGYRQRSVSPHPRRSLTPSRRRRSQSRSPPPPKRRSHSGSLPPLRVRSCSRSPLPSRGRSHSRSPLPSRGRSRSPPSPQHRGNRTHSSNKGSGSHSPEIIRDSRSHSQRCRPGPTPQRDSHSRSQSPPTMKCSRSRSPITGKHSGTVSPDPA